ncbi:MAG TPA: biotin-dependent carboxyltransferase family protein [Longilinea sp.]|nr:biotin-dependent carboxyltransferase family protein [Longilinea sp.]
MWLDVLSPGPYTAVRDLGRTGFAHIGVPVCGPMDAFAFRAANRLAGNPPESALLEFLYEGPEVVPAVDCVAVLTGYGYSMQVDKQKYPAWLSVIVRAGQTIRLQAGGQGRWGYLAISGGLDIPLVMGSRSTQLRGSFGGWQGRVLQAGDRLPLGYGQYPWSIAGKRLPESSIPAYSTYVTVPAVPAPQSDWFTPESYRAFWESEYRITAQSDRMGSRLEGPALALEPGQAELLSEGVIPGVVQVPSGGQPVVLMADCQTTGGYPKIAVVPQAGLPLLAQCPPVDGTVKFKSVTLDEAQSAWQSLLAGLKKLE